MRACALVVVLGAGCIERALPIEAIDASAADRAVGVDADADGPADGLPVDAAVAPDAAVVRAWQPAVELSHDGFGIFGYFPSVAINASGAAAVAWREDNAMAPRHIWAARYSLGAGWQDAEVVPFSTAFVNGVSVGVDDSGQPVASLGLDPPELGHYDAASATWVVQTLVSPPGNIWFGISPWLPTATRVVALWQENPNTGGDLSALWAGRYDLFGWTEIGQLDPPGAEAIEGFDLSATADGQAAAIWGRWLNHANQIWTARLDPATETWGEAVRLDDGSHAHPATPSIAVDDAGNALAIWMADQSPSATLQVRRYDAATQTWGPAQDLGAASGEQPRIALSAGGEALAMWREWSFGADTHLHYSRCLGGVWQAPQQLMLGPSGTIADFDLAMNAGGVAVVAWELLHVGESAKIYATRLE